MWAECEFKYLQGSLWSVKSVVSPGRPEEYVTLEYNMLVRIDQEKPGHLEANITVVQHTRGFKIWVYPCTSESQIVMNTNSYLNGNFKWKLGQQV